MPFDLEQKRAYPHPDDADRDAGSSRPLEIVRYSDLTGSAIGADVPLTNIPHQLNTLIGRSQEVAKLRQLLADSRLVTLTGAGGVGKTQIALEAVSDLLWQYRDGVWFIDLSAVTDPALIPQAMASALDLPMESDRWIIDSLRDYLRDRQILLILDTCAHLIEACAALVGRLLGSAANLSFLVTSREPLRLPGEIIWSVAPLPVPDLRRLPPFEELLTFASIRLFADRAVTYQPDFVLTKKNASIVARICAHLDGLPLPIELAAARIRTLPLHELERRLEDGLDLLSNGHRTAPARHQTLQANFAWSFKLLNPPEQVMLSRLSVFPDDWTLEAAEAVVAGEGIAARDVLDLVSALIEKSLVVADLRADGIARYRLLRTVRWYGQEQIKAGAEQNTLRRRHIEYFLDMAERAEQALHSPAQTTWLDRLDREHENLRAALEWSFAGGRADLGSRLAVALSHFWYLRNHFSEGQRWLSRALAPVRENDAVVPNETRAKTHNAAGWIAYTLGDMDNALEHATASLDLFRQAEDHVGIAEALALQCLVIEQQGDPARAGSYGEESLALCREAGDRLGIARALTCLGIVLERQGQPNRAGVLFTEALSIQRDLGDLSGIAFSLSRLGFVKLQQRDYARAVSLFRESLALHWELGDRAGTAATLEKLACVTAAQGEPERAARLCGIVTAMRDVSGIPMLPFDRADFASLVSTLRTTLGDAAFVEDRDEGRSLSVLEAVNEVLEESGPAPFARLNGGRPDAESPPGKLTRREFEVASLVADGLTNREIAEKLTISARTVDTHVTHILRKQEFGCRSQIAAWIAEMRLPAPPPR